MSVYNNTLRVSAVSCALSLAGAAVSPKVKNMRTLKTAQTAKAPHRLAARRQISVSAAGQEHSLSLRSSMVPAKQPDTFMAKVRAAWHIFFPPKQEEVSPREAGKSRLRMILVADRCGLNQASMYEMRHSIVRAVSDYVEIEAEDLVEVNISSEPEMGTVYSVAVPVRRVRPQARTANFIDGETEADGVTLMWDEDPNDRFPYGC